MRNAAIQEFRVAAAELARVLRIDPEIPLWPLEDFRFPMALDDPWYQLPVADLVQIALDNRPELAENRAEVQAAVERVRAARYRPLLPNLVLNYSWGDFGGARSQSARIEWRQACQSRRIWSIRPNFAHGHAFRF